MKNRLLIVLFVLFSITALSAGKKKDISPVIPPVKPAKSVEYLQVPLPAWVTNPPQDTSTVIGIAPNTSDKDYNDEFAKSMAAVSLSRNTSSYNIAKLARIYADDNNSAFDESAEFNHTVSADTSLMYRLASSLKEVSSCTLPSYKLMLFRYTPDSTSKFSIDSTAQQTTLKEKPAWFCDLGVKTADAGIYGYGFSRSAELVEAWEEAQELALREIAKYESKIVKSMIKQRNEDLSNAITIETITKAGAVKFSQIGILMEKRGPLISYLVYMELKKGK